MTISTQHKTSYVNLGLHVAQNNQAFDEEKELFETTNPSLGGPMWKVLMTMIDTHRKTTGEAHDELPFVVRHGYARHGYTINKQEHV